MAKKLDGADFFTAPTTPKASKAEAAAATTSAAAPKKRANNVTACFKISADTLAKIRAIAYWERVTNKEVLETALARYFAEYEKANGSIDLKIPKPTMRGLEL